MSDLEAARRGDEKAFARLIEPHRRELRAHCYRMSGRMHDADDLLQESLVRAWRGLGAFEGRASLRTWLYKLTTHVCIDKSAGAEARRAEELVEPCPVELYADLEVIASPEARIAQREAIGLAFAVALQRLTAQQRAVLILRDVLGMTAAECAELLDITVTAVNSALVRSRDAVATAVVVKPVAHEDERAVLAKYIAAWEQADTSALVALLRDDARLAMPPLPDVFDGAAAIGGVIEAMVFGPAGAGAFRFRTIEANGAVAYAMWGRGEDGVWGARSIHVVEVDAGGAIARMTAFMDPSLFVVFGLPETIA